MVLWLAVTALALPALVPPPLAAKPRTENIAYFVNTPYELNIYKIHGRRPGPTLMIIGGIQGDEPGGLLSADLYADMALERGNLIVVPRANFNSILQFKRGVNGDMNRRFAPPQGPAVNKQVEDRIVALLKSLIAESDCLLNLHEGSGFYSPHWESRRINPLRFGQSIIADTARFYSPQQQRWLELQATAERVMARVNPLIPEPRFRFRFNNHRTGEPDTLHPEQRRSATYYALTSQGIPAFGVETSKDLPTTEMKVLHHKLIINAFMEELGILPETPPVNLEPPRLAYLVIAVNDGLPVVVRDRQTLRLRSGDRLEVVHIEANYQRGLSADLIGLGSLNDVRKPFAINADTDIVVRKDHLKCGLVHLAVGSGGGAGSPVPSQPGTQLGFIVRVNGRQYFYPNDTAVHLVCGDRFQVVDVLLPAGVDPRVTVNVKGYMSDPANNTGEDRGFVIDTSKDLLQRHSVDKQGRHYLVIVRSEREIGRLHLILEPPHLRYLAVCIDAREKRWYQPGDTIRLRRQQTLQVMDIQANTPPDERLSLHCSQQRFDLGTTWHEKVLHLADLLPAPSGPGTPCSFAWTVKRRDLPLGQVFVQVSP